ncbi:MAG: DMT family transporter [Comamonadaceae bacterium]|jgi:drug/metabolite transporter (DMT)-like permease|nr:DMT family transporter [Comamonadaceae bacterium]
MNSVLAPVLALLFATSAWGSLFLVGKPLLASVDPVWFTTFRYALATALLAALVQLFGHSPWRKLREDALRLTLLGLAGYGCFSVLVFWGLARSLPSHGSVIMATMPFTTLLLRWALDAQRPSAASLAGAGVALVGVATVAHVLGAPAATQQTGATMLLGDLVTLAGTLGWVLYTRGAASLPHHSPLEYTALTAVAATPWLVLGATVATLLGALPAPRGADAVMLLPPLLYIAVVPTVLAALAFNFGVRRLGPAVGTLFLNVVPVSVLVVHALQGQMPEVGELAGAALVGAALGFNAWAGRRAAPAAAGASGQRQGAGGHRAGPASAAQCPH